MNVYNILRITTLKQYEENKNINIVFGYDFGDGDNGEVILNKLLITNLVSITHDNHTGGIETRETNYRFLHGNYIGGIEIDGDPTGLIPIKERSWIVFGKRVEG
jgi:hypothetical protein